VKLLLVNPEGSEGFAIRMKSIFDLRLFFYFILGLFVFPARDLQACIFSPLFPLIHHPCPRFAPVPHVKTFQDRQHQFSVVSYFSTTTGYR